MRVPWTTAVCPTPIPTPTGSAVAIVCASDPWAWNLDATLAVWAIVVAGLGAVATSLIALFALIATNRANRLQREAQERTTRFELVSGVEDYLDHWVETGGRGDLAKRATSEARLISRAAGISSDAEAVVKWIITALRDANEQVAAEHRANVALGEVAGRALARYGPYEVRRRVADWVATGRFDHTPLISPLPEPPPFEGYV